MKLLCGVYGEGAVISVHVEPNATVHNLQEAIVKAKTSVRHRFQVNPATVTLYLARKKGETTWMKHDCNTDTLLHSSIGHEYAEMHPACKLDDKELFGKDFAPADGEIHVLVKLPHRFRVLGKRKLSSERVVQLRDLWDYSEMNAAALPKPKELRGVLQRRLPFRLILDDGSIADQICDMTGDVVHCKDLKLLMESFLLYCSYPVEERASKCTWQTFYDALFRITCSVCRARGVLVSYRRNRTDSSRSTLKASRPDLILHYSGLILLRAEERSRSTPIGVSRWHLLKKMRRWNKMFYGDLPYILALATSGSRFQIFTTDCFGNEHTVVDFDVFMEKEEVVKTFYNLSFLIYTMVGLFKETHESPFLPFTPHVNERRTTELMDGFFRRTIKRRQCIDDKDFQRRVEIYTTLQVISNQANGRTHLQTVLDLNRPTKQCRNLTVQLQPVGFCRKPSSVEEVHEWILGMLTALKFWHGNNYCHGDVQWGKIVYVAAQEGAHWVLIGMDKSDRPNATTITWSHPRNGDVLTFEHDLYELGCLMENLGVFLSSALLRIQTALLSALTTKRSATDMLGMVEHTE